MIKSIITERIINKQYIQRSKLFIYPFLYIPQDSIIHPEQTYIGWIHNGRELIQSTDKKLICIFNKMTDSDQRKEEKKYLLILFCREALNRFVFINTESIHSALLFSINPMPPILQAML